MKPFHEKLKELVSARGLTAHGFAIKYGFNVSTISDIIEGRSNPKLDTVMKIAECLDISIAELLCDPGELVALDEKRAMCNAMCKRICNYDDISRSRLLGYMDCMYILKDKDVKKFYSMICKDDNNEDAVKIKEIIYEE